MEKYIERISAYRRKSLSINTPKLADIRDIKVHENILECIGNTPMVKLQKVPSKYKVECEIYAKCEFMNPGGSIKDRIAKSLLNELKTKHRKLYDNAWFVEETSGNTGIGLALATAIHGKPLDIVTSVKNSNEKAYTMNLLGATVIRSKLPDPTEIAWNIRNNITDRTHSTGVILDQFSNKINPLTHYNETCKEILDAMNNKVDMIVGGAGSGGTMTGISYGIKEKYPSCLAIISEPDGSIMFNTDQKAHPFLIEGMGGSTVPILLDKSIIDGFEVVNDEEAFLMARELVSLEGLLCGGSSGAIVAAAIKAILNPKYKFNHAKNKVVVILPDGIRNYMTKFVCDQWMEAHFFKNPPHYTDPRMSWYNCNINELHFNEDYPIVAEDATCHEALIAMSDKQTKLAIVCKETADKRKLLIGVVTANHFRYEFTNPEILPEFETQIFDWNDLVTEHLAEDVYTVPINHHNKITVGRLSRILDITGFVILGTEENCVTDNIQTKIFYYEHVCTTVDIINFQLQKQFRHFAINE